MADYDDPRPSAQEVGTTEQVVAKDNLITFDKFMNADSSETVTNRKGVVLTTVSQSSEAATEAMELAVEAAESAAESEANVTEIESDLNELYEDLSETVIPDGPNASDGTEYGFAITDKKGSAVAYVTNEGEFFIGDTSFESNTDGSDALSVADEIGIVSSSVEKDGSNVVGNATFIEQQSSDYDFAITDSAGNVCFAVKKDGTLFSAESDDSDDYDDAPETDDYYIESYGQSLSLGFNAYGVVSTSQQYNNVMFDPSVRYDTEQDLTSYISLVETLDGNTGETPVSAITNYLSENDDNYSANNTRYIGSASGRAGRSIAELSKGSGFYTRMLARFQAAYDLSVSQGRSISVPGIWFTQGEQDYVYETTAEDWNASLETLHDNIRDDFNDVTSSNVDFPMFFYQVASHRYYDIDYPTIALAQEGWQGETNKFCVCAMYNMDYTDEIHLQPESYYRMGWYYGKALSDYRETGEVKCLRIKQAKHYGTFIDVILDVPVEPIVIDTTQVLEAENYGFYVTDSSRNVLDIIDSVSVSGTNRIKITLSTTDTTGYYLTYAFGDSSTNGYSGYDNGPRGNIRDSQGDTMTITDQAGNSHRGDNWLLISEVTIK